MNRHWKYGHKWQMILTDKRSTEIAVLSHVFRKLLLSFEFFTIFCNFFIIQLFTKHGCFFKTNYLIYAYIYLCIYFNAEFSRWTVLNSWKICKTLQKEVENSKESWNPRNEWCTSQHEDFNRSFIREYHPSFAAIFSVPARTKQFKIRNKHWVY